MSKRKFPDTPPPCSKRLCIEELSLDELGKVVRWSSVSTLCNLSQANQFLCVFVRERAKAMLEEMEEIANESKALHGRIIATPTLYGLLRLCGHRPVIPVRFYYQVVKLLFGNGFICNLTLSMDTIELLWIAFGYEETRCDAMVETMTDVLVNAVSYQQHESNRHILRRRHVEWSLALIANRPRLKKIYTIDDDDDPNDADYSPPECEDEQEDNPRGVIIGVQRSGFKDWEWIESLKGFIEDNGPFCYECDYDKDFKNPCICSSCTDDNDSCNVHLLFEQAKRTVVNTIVHDATDNWIKPYPVGVFKKPPTNIERIVESAITATAHGTVTSSEIKKYTCVKDIAMAWWVQRQDDEWRRRAIANPEEELRKLGIEFQRGKTWHDAELLNQAQRPT